MIAASTGLQSLERIGVSERDEISFNKEAERMILTAFLGAI